MSATDYLRRCKYKNNFANDKHCELFFCKKTSFFIEFSHFVSIFSSFIVIICKLYTHF